MSTILLLLLLYVAYKLIRGGYVSFTAKALPGQSTLLTKAAAFLKTVF